jgi:hypothetical protein
MPANKEDDILKLYSYLKDEKKTKEIGSNILKAMIRDMIRAKLGYSGINGSGGPGIWGDVWVRYDWIDVRTPTLGVGVQHEVSKALSEIAADAKLTDEELRIAKELGVLKKEEE